MLMPKCGVWPALKIKKVSEIEHFDFLISVYSGLVKSPANVKTITKIKKDLEKIIK